MRLMGWAQPLNNRIEILSTLLALTTTTCNMQTSNLGLIVPLKIRTHSGLAARIESYPLEVTRARPTLRRSLATA